jgi:PelA/Pel-15E family pectate lyase
LLPLVILLAGFTLFDQPVTIYLAGDSTMAQVVAAIDAAAAWFREAAIMGYHYVPRGDIAPREGAGPLWARFYEIGTNRPIFSDRDGQVR